MAATTQNLVCDLSTLTNFVSWGNAISTFIGSSATWTKSSDTGQVNWGTISSVPTSTVYVYEIWEPNDGLTPFFLKVEYGNNGSNAAFRVSLAQSTDGAGNLVGNTVGPFVVLAPHNTPSATTQFECRFSGAPGRLSFLLWRGPGTSPPAACVFAVERSLNASGTYTGDYVTLVAVQNVTNNFEPVNCQTLHFTFGIAPASCVSGDDTGSGLPCRIPRPAENVSANFNGSIPMDLVSPFIGFWDYPMTSVGGGPNANYTDGQVVTTTVYGTTRSYVASNEFHAYLFGSGSTGVILVRWD